MISQGITIPWIYSDEYIKLDFTRIQTAPSIIQTIDVTRSSGEVRALNVESKWSKQGSVYKLTLTYRRENNPDLSETDFDSLWGVATIDIDPKKHTGNANWEGYDTTYWDGDVQWNQIDEQIVGDRKRERISRIQRQQSQLRQALLLIDKECAISREKLSIVLDAAHIIAAAEGGREVVENAILLRADLHRLLDAGLICIDTSGTVNIDSTLSDKYVYHFHGTKIPESILDRINNALALAITKRKP